MNKTIIAERFSKAIATYPREANVQRQIADKMIRLLKKYIAFVIYAPAYNSSQLPLTLKSTPAGINTLPPFLRL